MSDRWPKGPRQWVWLVVAGADLLLRVVASPMKRELL